jgi:hypothetical protein
MSGRPPNPRAGLFRGFWLDANGAKIGRIRRDEYPAIYDIWRKHADIRLGVRPLGMAASWHKADGELCGNERLRATGACASCCLPLAADNGDAA